jgi:hypothetical protein
MRKTKIFLRVSFILLALSGVLFAGCSSGSDDDGPPQTKPVTPISGVQVYDNTGTPYTTPDITFIEVDAGVGDDASLTDLGLTDASVGVTSGQLTLNMGTKNVVAGELGNLADDGFTVNPPSARFYQIKKFEDGSGNELQLLKVEGGQKKEHASLFYATEAARVSGDDNGTYIDRSFGKGWTWLINDVTGPHDILLAGSPDAGFKWYINFP